MKKYLIGFLGLLFVLVLVALGVMYMSKNSASAANPQSSAPTDPQKLLIPRWFLREMTVNGQSYETPEQSMNLQFKEDGSANGKSGCNQFSGTYEAGQDGSMKFGSLTSTLMACDEGMDRESAFLDGMGQVQNYSFEGSRLVLESSDGQTRLVFSMPPK